MAEFVNPYNFVRSDYDAHNNAEPFTHERIHLGTFSGRMHCNLKTITRITTKSFHENNYPCIYGSTLKGLIRSIAEAVAKGCFPVADNNKCNGTRLCICCRIFGWMGNNESLHLGRINISDANPGESNWRDPSSAYFEEHALSSPKEKHAAFYKAGNRNRGRKFYYHHLPGTEQKVIQTGTDDRRIVAAKPGITFPFQVDFTDLSSAELGLLIYALQLEEGLFHKIGKGKSLGFGTVKISIDNVFLLRQNRYENWDATLTAVESLPLEELRIPQIENWEQLEPHQKRGHFADTRVDSFFREQFNLSYADRLTLPHIRDIKSLFSQHDDYPIHYPSGNWFNKNAKVELPTAEEVESDINWLED